MCFRGRRIFISEKNKQEIIFFSSFGFKKKKRINMIMDFIPDNSNKNNNSNKNKKMIRAIWRKNRCNVHPPL